jgi:4-aminobutyrate aminotransferase
MLGCGKSTIRISPPLCLTKAEADEGLDIFNRVISLAERGL